jgi:hypothetical protein
LLIGALANTVAQLKAEPPGNRSPVQKLLQAGQLRQQRPFFQAGLRVILAYTIARF